MPGSYIWAGFIPAVLLLLLSPIKIKINLEFRSSPEDAALDVNISALCGRWRRNYPLPDISVLFDYALEKSRGEKTKKSGRSKGKLSPGVYYSLAVFAMKRVTVEKLDWKSRVGLDDAMHTAISSGGLWALKGILAGLLSGKTRLRDINLQVEPDFNDEKLVSRLCCILKLRIAHIILIAFYFLVLAVRGYINGHRAGTADPSH